MQQIINLHDINSSNGDSHQQCRVGLYQNSWDVKQCIVAKYDLDLQSGKKSPNLGQHHLKPLTQSKQNVKYGFVALWNVGLIPFVYSFLYAALIRAFHTKCQI